MRKPWNMNSERFDDQGGNADSYHATQVFVFLTALCSSLLLTDYSLFPLFRCGISEPLLRVSRPLSA